MEKNNPPPVPKAVPTKEDFDRLKEWYAEELERKDALIEQLRKENMLLVRASLKTSERLATMQETKPTGPSVPQDQAHRDP
jgi:hypothetical protein